MLTRCGHRLYTCTRGCWDFCPFFQVRYTTTLPFAPSQASMFTTSSSHDPVGGLNSAFLALADGVSLPGCPLRPRFAPLPFVSLVARALFLPLLLACFVSSQALSIDSRPPTLLM